MPKCQYKLEKQNRLCKNNASIGNYCSKHPEECVICLFKLTKDNIQCECCKNIIHILCVVNSGIELCPFCRFNMNIPKKYQLLLNSKKKELYHYNNPSNWNDPFIATFLPPRPPPLPRRSRRPPPPPPLYSPSPSPSIPSSPISLTDTEEEIDLEITFSNLSISVPNPLPSQLL